MLQLNNQVFRITYEAFSKFTNNLIRCRTFDDITGCFKINLKYLFNFHVFRASYHRHGRYIHLQVCKKEATIVVSDQPDYAWFEQILLQSAKPVRRPVAPHQLMDGGIEIADTGLEHWGWSFRNDERTIVVSVIAGDNRLFNEHDISFVKQVSENLELKLLQLCLFEELDEKNRSLEEAIEIIHQKNAIITSIIDEQKQIIGQRTSEVEEKNKALLEISVLNAHTVREPLSRIMGLLSLFDIYNSEMIIAEIVPLLKTSGNDLDIALQSVIGKATAELMQLKA